MKKSRKLTAFLLIIFLTAVCIGDMIFVAASEEVPLTPPVIMLYERLDPIEVKPGEKLELKIPVKATQFYAKNPVISAQLKDIPFELKSGFVLSREGYKGDITNITVNECTWITFTLEVKETARKGDYNLILDFATVDNRGDFTSVSLSDKTPIVLRVTEEKMFPTLKLNQAEYAKNIVAGQKFDIAMDVQNEGELEAKNVKIALSGYEDAGILPDSLYSSVTLPDLEQGQEAPAVFTVMASKSITPGVKSITATITYETADGTKFEDNVKLYIEVPEKKKEEEVKTAIVPKVFIESAKQSPASPKAEGTVTLSFYIENKGTADMTDIKLIPSNLSSTTLIPVSSEPYEYIEKLKIGQRKKVKMKFKLAKTIQEGLNSVELKVTYSYIDKDKQPQVGEDAASIYVLNVQKAEEIASDLLNSTPKIIIKSFTTGVEKLKAGDVFNFQFTLINSHNSAKAKNIKITISSADNVFSITQGSNSFYISEIAPGGIKETNIELKVKGDSATKAYPLNIKFEYEFDGVDENFKPITKQNTLEDTINIMVYENARPVISNIAVGYFEPPVVNEISTMSFEFYNYGKSSLYNVSARVEGDFQQSGNMLFIGTVEAGSGKSWEMDVTPLLEGTASGTLYVTYEDSNGEAVELSSPFTAEIAPAENSGGMNPGDMNPGDFDPTGGEEEVKKDIIPLGVFIAIQGAIFILAVPISRKIVLVRYKKKHQNDEA